MLEHADFTRLVRGIYDAALDDSNWSEVMLRIGDLMGGSAVTLAGRLANENTVTILGAERIDPAAFEIVAKDYTSVEANPRLRFQHLLPVGAPVSRAQLVDDEYYRRSWFYNDVLRHADLFHELIISLRCDDVSASAISVLRSERAPPYELGEIQALQQVIPHLQAALEVRTRLQAALAERTAMMEVLDRVPWGVVLLSASGQVLDSNHRARQILDSGEALVFGRNGLRCIASESTGKLHRLIAGAAGGGPGGAISLPRTGARQPLSLFVAPLLGARGEACDRRTAVALFINDPDFAPGTSPAILHQLYGLTRTEAAVAVEVAGGAGLDSVASRLGLGRNTVKTHLSRVFDKTGTHRQAELARLVMGMAVDIGPPHGSSR